LDGRTCGTKDEDGTCRCDRIPSILPQIQEPIQRAVPSGNNAVHFAARVSFRQRIGCPFALERG